MILFADTDVSGALVILAALTVIVDRVLAFYRSRDKDLQDKQKIDREMAELARIEARDALKAEKIEAVRVAAVIASEKVEAVRKEAVIVAQHADIVGKDVRDVNATVKATHLLVNGRMLAQLKMTAAVCRRLAETTKDVNDFVLAKAADEAVVMFGAQGGGGK